MFAKANLVPKFLTVLREGISRKLLITDLTAGLVVGVVALPMAIAFGIASGVRPEQGLYTAIVTGFLISLLSGSRVQIGGPTGAFIVLVYGIVQKYGYDGLALCTLMAGVLLVIMGLARLGNVIKFIPFPVTVGFTGGIALIILVGQLRDLLGLSMDKVPAEFVDKCLAFGQHIHTVNGWAVLIGAITIAAVVLTPRFTRRVPGSLIAILVTTLVVQLLKLPVETIGSRFGEIPSSLPMPHLPNLDFGRVRELFSPAVSVALLAGIESLLSAVVADGMTGRRHRSNMELVAQGIANIASPFFGGIPATGAIARTATNIKSGGRSPIAGIFHAVVLMVIMVAFGRWAALIPMATLAGILVVVAYNMSELHLFVKLMRAPRSDQLVLGATFLLTVLVDLTVAIQAGVVMAALLFMRRMASESHIASVRKAMDDDAPERESLVPALAALPQGVEVFDVEGPLFFAMADKFKDALGELSVAPKVLILGMKHVNAVDASGLIALEDILNTRSKLGITLILSGVHAQPLVAMERARLVERIGDANLCGSLETALIRARQVLGLPLAPPPTRAVNVAVSQPDSTLPPAPADAAN